MQMFKDFVEGYLCEVITVSAALKDAAVDVGWGGGGPESFENSRCPVHLDDHVCDDGGEV